MDEYINSNISTATLEGLAKVFGYSKVYTSGLIKKFTSLGYKQYLHKKRLEKAVDLLLNSPLSIAEIIKLCGYENTSYFRKIFKEAYNVNPYEYRQRRVSRND